MHSNIVSAIALLAAAALAAPTTPQEEANANVPTVDNSCDNKGYNFAIFENASPKGATALTQWNPDEMNQNGKASVLGVRKVIGVAQDMSPPSGDANPSMKNIYDSFKQVDTNHMGLKHYGFFFAATGGTYTVDASADDGAYVFLGGECCGANGASHGPNEAELIGMGGGSRSIQNVQAGTYVPFDLRCANILGGPYGCAFTIKDPNGNVILDASSPSPNVVTKVCDGNQVFQCPNMQSH